MLTSELIYVSVSELLWRDVPHELLGRALHLQCCHRALPPGVDLRGAAPQNEVAHPAPEGVVVIAFYAPGWWHLERSRAHERGAGIPHGSKALRSVRSVSSTFTRAKHILHADHHTEHEDTIVQRPEPS